MPLVMDTRPAAYCVIVREGKILLTHFSTVTAAGHRISGWTLPGGGMERGEQPEQTALREVFEETGYEAQVDGLVGVHAGYSDRPDGSTFCALRTVFTARIISGEFAIEADGSTNDARWVPLNELDLYIPQASKHSMSPHFLTAVVAMMGFDSALDWSKAVEKELPAC